jgi:anthranilate synthase component 1
MKPAKPSTKTLITWPSDLAALHRLNPSRYPFLLESAAIGNSLGRYDLLFAFPQDSLRLQADFSLSGHTVASSGNFLESFDQWWSEESIPTRPDCEQPFSGGWFLLLGYELAQQIESTLDLQTKSDQPIATAIRVPIAVIRDHHEGQAWIIAEAGSDAMVQHILHDLEKLPTTGAVDNHHEIMLERQVVEDDPEDFINAVKQAQRYIVAGDIFQANLSRQWGGSLRPGMQPVDIYTRLRRSNPAPFAGLAVFDDFAVISSSPERLLRIRGNRVETRPIAGTRPRSPSRRGDAQLREELLANAKERAEHVMVIDLERNDLGRICQAGSIEVDEFMVIESYPHVHHIVSNISGRLNDDTTPGAIIAAMFPGGSITGCPKVRCMEVINELEDRPRGMYTGAMGYINRDGSGDLSILIRCITMAGHELSLATGCGIVTDSKPDAELAETHAKAKGLILALTEC